MKILFVSSGNNKYGISPIVRAQGESLKTQELVLEYFTIQGKGTLGYLKSLSSLKNKIKMYDPSLIHAHYSLSAIAASLVCRKPMVVSLMGSDTVVSLPLKLIIQFFAKFKWKAIIVKSASMSQNIHLPEAIIMPNGVDTGFWRPLDKSIAKQKVGFDGSRIQVVWLSNPSRFSKNYELAEHAFQLIDNRKTELKVIFNIPHEEVLNYLNAADILLITSRWEGSPNIIKEAMACNCPIVATDVGDIKNILGQTEGCYITTFNPDDIAQKIHLALNFVMQKGRTKGRDRILKLGLDSSTVAQRLTTIYRDIIAKR